MCNRYAIKPIQVTARSMLYVSGSLPVGIMGSNPSGGMNVCPLLSVVCYQVQLTALRSSVVQRNLTECGLSKECGYEAK
jgi:hypothetical protein